MSENSWIEVGAPVVVLTQPMTGPPSWRNATVEKVNRKTFRVTGEENTFALVNRRENVTGAWSHSDLVVHPDDPQVEQVKGKIRLSNAKHRVDTAHSAWRRDQNNRELLTALIEAATKCDQEIERAALAPQPTDWLA